jgi:putative (di)nucleoside polyphosphate hydrolase
MQHVVVFKRRVYASALRHLAPFARQVAGAQAIPPPAPEARWPARRAGRRRGRAGAAPPAPVQD